MTRSSSLTIDHRFCGPPASGNGGYTAGSLAGAMGIGTGDAVEVRLRVPPPLDRPLTVVECADATELRDGPTVVAEARRIAEVGLEPPSPATWDEAAAAAATPFAPDVHPFPTCFACGPGRAPGDGLRLFAGTVPGRDVFACTWVPDASVAGADGEVLPAIVFAALDCPGGQAVSVFGDAGTAVLLGTIGAVHRAPVRVGQRCVLTSWRIATEGRKHTTGVLLTDASGVELGRSRAIWIAVDAPPA